MTTANAIAMMPTWPRRLQEDMAAAYCGVSRSKFRSGIRSGRFPEGRPDGGNVLWYIEDLDAALDILKDGGGTLNREDTESDAWLQDLNEDGPH